MYYNVTWRRFRVNIVCGGEAISIIYSECQHENRMPLIVVE